MPRLNTPHGDLVESYREAEEPNDEEFSEWLQRKNRQTNNPSPSEVRNRGITPPPQAPARPSIETDEIRPASEDAKDRTRPLGETDPYRNYVEEPAGSLDVLADIGQSLNPIGALGGRLSGTFLRQSAPEMGMNVADVVLRATESGRELSDNLRQTLKLDELEQEGTMIDYGLKEAMKIFGAYGFFAKPAVAAAGRTTTGAGVAQATEDIASIFTKNPDKAAKAVTFMGDALAWALTDFLAVNPDDSEAIFNWIRGVNEEVGNAHPELQQAMDNYETCSQEELPTYEDELRMRTQNLTLGAAFTALPITGKAAAAIFAVGPRIMRRLKQFYPDVYEQTMRNPTSAEYRRQVLYNTRLIDAEADRLRLDTGQNLPLISDASQARLGDLTTAGKKTPTEVKTGDEIDDELVLTERDALDFTDLTRRTGSANVGVFKLDPDEPASSFGRRAQHSMETRHQFVLRQHQQGQMQLVRTMMDDSLPERLAIDARSRLKLEAGETVKPEELNRSLLRFINGERGLEEGGALRQMIRQNIRENLGINPTKQNQKQWAPYAIATYNRSRTFMKLLGDDSARIPGEVAGPLELLRSGKDLTPLETEQLLRFGGAGFAGDPSAALRAERVGAMEFSESLPRSENSLIDTSQLPQSHTFNNVRISDTIDAERQLDEVATPALADTLLGRGDPKPAGKGKIRRVRRPGDEATEELSPDDVREMFPEMDAEEATVLVRALQDPSRHDIRRGAKLGAKRHSTLETLRLQRNLKEAGVEAPDMELALVAREASVGDAIDSVHLANHAGHMDTLSDIVLSGKTGREDYYNVLRIASAGSGWGKLIKARQLERQAQIYEVLGDVVPEARNVGNDVLEQAKALRAEADRDFSYGRLPSTQREAAFREHVKQAHLTAYQKELDGLMKSGDPENAARIDELQAKILRLDDERNLARLDAEIRGLGDAAPKELIDERTTLQRRMDAKRESDYPQEELRRRQIAENLIRAHGGLRGVRKIAAAIKEAPTAEAKVAVASHLLKQGTANTIVGVRTSLMLSDPKTHTRNIFSNMLNIAEISAARFTGRLITGRAFSVGKSDIEKAVDSIATRIAFQQFLATTKTAIRGIKDDLAVEAFGREARETVADPRMTEVNQVLYGPSARSEQSSKVLQQTLAGRGHGKRFGSMEQETIQRAEGWIARNWGRTTRLLSTPTDILAGMDSAFKAYVTTKDRLRNTLRAKVDELGLNPEDVSTEAAFAQAQQAIDEALSARVRTGSFLPFRRARAYDDALTEANTKLNDFLGITTTADEGAEVASFLGGQRATFTESLGPIARRIADFRDTLGIVGRTQSPFVGAVNHIARKIGEVATGPLAALSPRINAILRRGGPEAEEAWGRVANSSIMLGALYGLVEAGEIEFNVGQVELIEGRAPMQPGRRALQETGPLPYSINIGGYSIGLQGLDPATAVLSMAAELRRLHDEFHIPDEDWDEIISNSALYLAEMMEDVTWFEKPLRLLGLIDSKDPLRGIANLVAEPLAQTVLNMPGGIGGHINKWRSNVRTYTQSHAENKWQAMAERWYNRSNLPGEANPVLYDLFGNPVKTRPDGAMWNALLFLPISVKEMWKNKKQQRAVKFAMALNNMGIGVPMPRTRVGPRAFDVKVKKGVPAVEVDLTEEEWSEWARVRGRHYREAFAELEQDTRGAERGEFLRKLNKALDNADEDAMKDFRDSRHYDRIKDRLKLAQEDNEQKMEQRAR